MERVEGETAIGGEITMTWARDGAAEQIAEGIARVDEIITALEEIPDDLRQQAFQLRWRVQILTDDPGAIATCRAFPLFPNRVLQMVRSISVVLAEMEEFEQALG